MKKNLMVCLLGFVLLFGGCAILQDVAGKFRLDLSGVFGGEESENEDNG